MDAETLARNKAIVQAAMASWHDIGGANVLVVDSEGNEEWHDGSIRVHANESTLYLIADRMTVLGEDDLFIQFQVPLTPELLALLAEVANGR
jgi:hypothetical protein